MTTAICTSQSVAVALGMLLTGCIGFASVSEENLYAIAGESEVDDNTEPDDANDTNADGIDDTDAVTNACRNIPFGSSCKEGANIYDVTFDGIVVASMEEREISLSDIRCDGFESVLLFSGDTW